jgi:tRNA-2-methylthio-N6-dimethylallyladenosine synthase
MVRFFIENYGCQMNLAEADALREALLREGHAESGEPENADVAIINTCSVRKTAEDRVYGRIGYYRGLKEKFGRNVSVVLMGCMAQNVGSEIREEFPDVVKLVWGTYNKEGIVDWVQRLEGGHDRLELTGYRFMDAEPLSRIPFKSFVPISHGCNNFCTYCIVPHVRGREVFRSSVAIVENVKRLVERGVLEFTLLGQNVNSYRDEDGSGFPELLDRLSRVDGVRRLTFLTSHPKDFGEKLASVIRERGNVMKLIHLPAQSGSDRILSLMNRKYTREDYLRKAELARTIPGAALTTDLIVGFPGETEAEYLETIELVKTVRFQEAYMYQYNSREGTRAAEMEGQVSQEEKGRRLSALIELQLKLAQGRLAERVGTGTEVLLEGTSRKNGREMSGRTHFGQMAYLEAEGRSLGTIVPVEIAEVSGTGLKARLLSHFR